MGKSRLSLSDAIKHCEEVALQKDTEAEEHNPRYTGLISECKECADEHRQLAEWLKILKSAKFEYDEAWRTITHPTPDVTYADKQRAQVILDKFRNSLGTISALQEQDVHDANVGDMISRQVAIDAVEAMVDKSGKGEIAGFYNAILERVIDKLIALLSAQPEIVMCKDCKYWRKHKYVKETKRYIPFCGFNAIYTKSDDFCSRAERREE